MAQNARRFPSTLVINHAIVWLILLAASSESTDSDISCLKSLKQSLEDPLNSLSPTWNFDNDTEGFICKFAGVDCWHPDESKVLNLQLSDMGLKGSFPLGLKNCTSLSGLDLSNNELSGSIPSDINERLIYLTSLDLSYNYFSGEIPPSIANMNYLSTLKLNNNLLEGRIPNQLGMLNRIKTFSVANNRLSGPVPNFTMAIYFPSENYENNEGLCGYPLDPCKEDGKNSRGDQVVKSFFISGLVVGWAFSTVFVFVLTLLYMPSVPVVDNKINKLMKKFKRNNRGQVNQRPTTDGRSMGNKVSILEKFATRMNFSELAKATDDFNGKNVIGFGKTGTTYKAMLQNGWLLAIKKFHDFQGSEEKLTSEVTILGKLRHINLVPLLGFCTQMNERLVVYKFMANGNLYDLLHTPSIEGEAKVIEWPLRVKIAVGLARGLAWLHHNSTYQVAHLNVSSKCVLLDKIFEPKISNFGEAKFINLNGTRFLANGRVLELGFGKEDVYNFGIILLELVTGEEPRRLIHFSKCFGGTSSSSAGVLYGAIVANFHVMGQGLECEISQLLTIACNCILHSPDLRPTMLQVYKEMGNIEQRYGLTRDSETSMTVEIAAASY